MAILVAKWDSSHGKRLALWDDNETVLFANMRDEEDRKAVENGEERNCFRISIHGGEVVKALPYHYR